VACFARFEIDIISALSSQLVDAFEKLDPGPLTEKQLDDLDPGQGVYQLFYKGAIVYVGQARSLKTRRAQHRKKISGRQNINVEDMGFKCLYVHANWTALAPEDALIKHHRKLGKGTCPWNGNGFGPHDPGRERETTNKLTEGFDALYPIRTELPCGWISPGGYNALDLLKALKRGLPYLLRFEGLAQKSGRRHAELLTARIEVQSENMAAEDLITLIAKELDGWQGTVFPSHMILYKESRAYQHGRRIWPLD
jgi:hypothetical protein